MKSQFIKIHEALGNRKVPGQPNSPDGRTPTAIPNGATDANVGYERRDNQPQWSLAQVQTAHSPALSLVDQETLEQRVVQPQQSQRPQRPQQSQQQPGWSNGVHGTGVAAQVQAILHGPISPRESGITPYAAMYSQAPAAPVRPQPQASPYAPAVASYAPLSQPLHLQQQGPNTNWPLMSMPGFSVMSPQSQGVSGPPPFIQPPAPPGGRRRKKRRFPIWARVLVGVLLFLMLLGGAGFTYYQVNFSQSVSDITGKTVARLPGDNNPNQGRAGDILSGSRINILLLGSDTDQKFGTSSGGSTVYLAQTDIVVTIDPQTKSVAMLSIPRDFYLNIPGYGMGKLDEAFEHGYNYGQGGFAGAVALSRLTIYQDFGIPINYYAWVGLDGFVKVIDTVGGVDVDVLHPITDDAYPDDVGNTTGDIYAYKRLYIAPGPQHLSGPAALEYVRSRHADLVGDFGRSARQQQVLSALKIKLMNSSIVTQLPQIAKDLDGFVKTDMQLTDVFKLMNFARTLDMNKIQHVVLDPPYSSPTSLPSGESIVQPNCSAIVPVINQLFQLNGQARCNISASSNNSSLATASTPTSQGIATASSANISQGASLLTSMSALSMAGSDNLLGYHSLLDLLFTVVFESPQAMLV